MSGFAMHSFGLPRSGGQSEAARRMAEAGMRYQRAKEAAEAPPPPKPPVVVVSPVDEQKVRLIQAALDSFNKAEVQAVSTDPVPRSKLATLVAGIKADACRIFDITQTELISIRRCSQAARARQYAAQRLRDETPLSMPQIGRTLGGRDHSTMVHACKPESRKKIAAWVEKLTETSRGAR